jgi:hypothetical protein
MSSCCLFLWQTYMPSPASLHQLATQVPLSLFWSHVCPLSLLHTWLPGFVIQCLILGDSPLMIGPRKIGPLSPLLTLYPLNGQELARKTRWSQPAHSEMGVGEKAERKWAVKCPVWFPLALVPQEATIPEPSDLIHSLSPPEQLSLH